MKVHHYNTYPYGGAANAALRIHRGLLEQKVDSKFLYRINDREPVTEPALVQLGFDESPKSNGIFSGLNRSFQKRRKRDIHQLYDQHLRNRDAESFEVFSMARLPDATRLDWSKYQSDVVHLHWLAHLADFPSFMKSIPNETPIVWTLHDMGAFSGGCHYSGGCQSFQNECGNCPQVVNANPHDVSADSMRAKRKAFRKKDLHVVSPSQWLLEQAKLSPVWPRSTQFSVIRYGLDLDTFKPYPKLEARTALQVSQDAFVIGFGADDIANPRKGFQHLVRTLKLLASDSHGHSHGESTKNRIELVVFGGGELPKELTETYRVHHFGFVDDPNRLAKIYSSCDLVAVPSIEDNQPQIGLEAMACGRPVVGFDAGGIPEYVSDGITGRVVPTGDENGLANAMAWLAKNSEVAQSYGERGRLTVESEFEIVRQSKAYVGLYQHLKRSSQAKKVRAA